MSSSDNLNKRFKITVTNLYVKPFPRELGEIEYIVEYEQLAETLRNIRKMGGKIMRITELN